MYRGDESTLQLVITRTVSAKRLTNILTFYKSVKFHLGLIHGLNFILALLIDVNGGSIPFYGYLAHEIRITTTFNGGRSFILFGI